LKTSERGVGIFQSEEPGSKKESDDVAHRDCPLFLGAERREDQTAKWAVGCRILGRIPQENKIRDLREKGDHRLRDPTGGEESFRCEG